MEILIASNDQPIAAKIRVCLQKAGLECPASQVLSHDSAQILATAPRGDDPALVFFGSPQLGPADLATLSQLCEAAGERFQVVAVGPDFTAGAILQAVRSGAIDCLSLNSDLEVELRHLLDRLSASQHEQSHTGKLFTVISPVGGSGASLIATNLAAAIAQRLQTCALLDLHWRGGDLATLFNSSPRHTLLSLAGKAESLDRTMFEQTLVRHECGVHLLASPEPFSDYRQIRPELVQKIVQLARAAYSTVVVDLEDCEHLDQVRTLAASDRIIVVIRQDFVSLVRTKKLLNYLTTANVSREHIALVANRTGQVKELPLHQAEEALGMCIGYRLPDSPATVNEAINLGVPLVVGCPKSRVTIELVRLAESLLGITSPAPSPTWAGAKLLPLKTMACLFSAATT